MGGWGGGERLKLDSPGTHDYLAEVGYQRKGQGKVKLAAMILTTPCTD